MVIFFVLLNQGFFLIVSGFSWLMICLGFSVLNFDVVWWISVMLWNGCVIDVFVIIVLYVVVVFFILFLVSMEVVSVSFVVE